MFQSPMYPKRLLSVSLDGRELMRSEGASPTVKTYCGVLKGTVSADNWT